MDLGHGGHGHVLNSGDCGPRRGCSARLLRGDAEERVEEGDAELSTAGEVHEEVDGVVGVVEKGYDRVEQPSRRPLLRRVVQKCSIGVPKEIDIDRDAEDEE